MTWSIVARDRSSGLIGAIVATHAVAVGSRCLFGQPGLAIGATQAITNRYLGTDVLQALSHGADAPTAMHLALRADEGRDIRQLHFVTAAGATSTWTGRHCIPLAGEIAGEEVNIAGNTLASNAVLADTYAAWERSGGKLAERLVEAMAAGLASGGDLRGTQSAALLVLGDEDFAQIDLRVDSDPRPLSALKELLSIWRDSVEPSTGWLPSRTNRSGVIELERWEALWRSRGQNHVFGR